MKKTIIAAAVLALIVSCKEIKQTENTEETLAEIETAQMQGKKAADELGTLEWKDSIELIDAVLKARSLGWDYEMRHKPQCAAAYDSVFRVTINEKYKELARHLK